MIIRIIINFPWGKEFDPCMRLRQRVGYRKTITDNILMAHVVYTQLKRLAEIVVTVQPHSECDPKLQRGKAYKVTHAVTAATKTRSRRGEWGRLQHFCISFSFSETVCIRKLEF